MACRYFLGDKELKGEALTSYMKNLPHEEKLKVAPEIAKDSYSRLSWTPGEAQAARYDLSKSVDEIIAHKNKDGTFGLIATMPHNQPQHPIGSNIPADKLSDYVGKDLAAKISKQDFGPEVYDGDKLKIGGEGMKGFYDQIVPKAVEKISGEKVKSGNAAGANKKIEVYVNDKWEPTDFKTRHAAENVYEARRVREVEQKQPIHYIDIPQSLKDKAMHKGFPLFSSTHMFTPVAGNPFDQK